MNPIMQWLENITAHPKTSVAGFLIACTGIFTVLSQQGITLGHAGTGTYVSLGSSLATMFLGLISKDPSA